MAPDIDGSDDGPAAEEIRRLGAAKEYAPLLMDIVAHPYEWVSLDEFAMLNPELVSDEIVTRLETLRTAGVLKVSTAGDTSTSREYYALTPTARTVFERHNMLAAEPLKEMFAHIEHSDDFLRLLDAPRPVESAAETE